MINNISRQNSAQIMTKTDQAPKAATTTSNASSTKAPQKKRKPGAGRPKGSNAKETVLDQASGAFVKHGYQACTVAHILEETGVSRTNFYRFFKNKETVFEALLQSKLKQLTIIMADAQKPADKNESTIDRLTRMLDLYLASCFSVGDLLPILFQEQQSLPAYRDLRESMISKIKLDIISDLKNNGYQLPSDLMLEALLAGIDRMVLIKATSPDDINSKINEIRSVCLQYTSILLQKS